MSTMVKGILLQKLQEIQSQLPHFVKIIKESPANFDEILSIEADQLEHMEQLKKIDDAASEEASEVTSAPVLNFKYNGSFDHYIDEASRKYHISSSIIKAVIKAESNFNPRAVSPKGAMGLMQLMPGTARSLGVSDAFNPKENIDGGVKFLRDLLKQFDGNLELALAGYNAGPGAVKKFGGIPPYKETQNYVKKIMGYLKNKI